MSINELMEKIVQYDCDPSVFYVEIRKSDHTLGFEVFLVFRHGHGESGRTLKYQGNDPEKLLEQAYAELQAFYGRCPSCGNYRHGMTFNENA